MLTRSYNLLEWAQDKQSTSLIKDKIMQHYNNPANIAHADMVVSRLAKHGITLEVIINHWKLKQVIIHQKNGCTRIANRASFNSFWSDADVITDVDTLSYIKDNFGIDLSDDALNTESDQTTQTVIDEVVTALASGYAELNNLADAYSLDHVCFEYKYSGLLYSVTVINSQLTYVISENARKGQKELLRYEAVISDCEHDQLNMPVCEYV